MPEETSPGAAREWVLFIHGTAAGDDADEGPRWWQRGSAFWQALRDDLGPAFLCQPEGHVFHWSGANREDDRRAAGSALLARLRTLEVPFHLIGHSHGGSVIWHAFVEATERGVALPHLASWTTVGTPFLHFKPVRLSSWALLPFLVALAAVALAASHLGLWLAVRAQFEPGAADSLLGRFAVPLLWVSPLLLLLLAFWHGLRWFAASTKARRERCAARVAFQRWGDCYLGVWARDDEAVSGLMSTLGFVGEITPRLAPPLARGWRGLATLLAAPVRWLYNGVAAPLSDEFILDRVARRLQGNAAGDLELAAVTRGPLGGVEGWPELPPELDTRLVDFANEHAAGALAGVRSTLAASAARAAELPGLFAGLRAQLTFRELIHNSYWEIAEIRTLLAAHVVRRSAASRLPVEAPAAGISAAWLDAVEARFAALRAELLSSAAATRTPQPRRRTARLAAAGHLGAVLLIAGSAFLERQAFEFAIAPLTPERQIEEVIRRAPAAGAALDSVLEGWVSALVRIGRVAEARALAAEESVVEKRATLEAFLAHALLESEQRAPAGVLLQEICKEVGAWSFIDAFDSERVMVMERLVRELAHMGDEKLALEFAARLEPPSWARRSPTSGLPPTGRSQGSSSDSLLGLRARRSLALGVAENGQVERALEMSRFEVTGAGSWQLIAWILRREKPPELALLAHWLNSDPHALEAGGLLREALDLIRQRRSPLTQEAARAFLSSIAEPGLRDRLAVAYLAGGGEWQVAEPFLSKDDPPSAFGPFPRALSLERTPDYAVALAQLGRRTEAAELLRRKGPPSYLDRVVRQATDPQISARFGLFAEAWAHLGEAEQAVRLLPFADCNVESLAQDPACRRVLRILAERGQIPAARLAISSLAARDQPLYLALLGRAAFADDASALLREAAAQLPVMRSEESRSVVAGVLAAGWVRTGNYRRALDLADRCPTRTRLEVATLALEHYALRNNG